ncbi:MAG: hypothetical protein FJ333_07040 [Sphingomonadales bacterium]|nr:hypothetical protein [Sphingomonadales bacterium]
MKQITHLVLVVVVGCAASLSAQVSDKKWANVLSISTTPSWSTRWITGYQPDERGGFTEAKLQDSFSISDKSLSTKNFGVAYSRKVNGFTNFVVGLSIVNTGFTRVKEGDMFRYVIHPDVGIYPNLVQAGLMEVHYEYRSRYAGALFAIDKRLDGSRFQMQSASMWYQLGVMPALLMKQNLQIHTIGFTMPQGNDFRVADYVANTVDTGVVLTKSQSVSANAFFTAALRLEYNLDPKLHIYASPRVMLPLLPSSRGVQTYWSPQIGCEVGLRLPLD